MASRQKKKESRDTIKKEVVKEDLKPTEATSAAIVVKENGKELILKELLASLISSVAVKFEVNKSFVNIKFPNSNSYYGWLGSNGFNGFGTYTFADGTSFRGTFEASLTKDLGRYTFANGNTYEGAFLAGQPHGYGKYKSKRFQYDGYFRNGMFHGNGVWKSNTEEQKGVYCYGKISHGEVRDSSGIFNGSFDQSGCRKQGKFTFNNGNTYCGSFSKDLFSGFGIYNWIEEDCPNTKAETKYIGYWLNGKRSGLGMLIFDHRCIICKWNDGRKSGAGVIVACNGNCYADTGMFSNNQYKTSRRVKLCQESQDIILQIIRSTTRDDVTESMDVQCDAFRNQIAELLNKHGDSCSPLYPIRIPQYEIGSHPFNTDLELRYLQQVFSENYKDFMDLYKRYTHPADDCMNNLGLNLFFMDVFQNVRDVNVADLTMAVNRRPWAYTDGKSCKNPLAAVSFNEFIQHFLRVTEVLMGNEDLQRAVEELRPTFFCQKAMQALYVLRMLQVHEVPQSLVREVYFVNRPAILSILKSFDDLSSDDRSIRVAFSFLNSKGLVSRSSGHFFVEAVEKYFENVIQDGVLCDVDLQISDMELVEIVLYTCHLKMSSEAK